MKKLALLLLCITFHIVNAQEDYYWVGGSGNWSDFATHWATASGGSTFHAQAPTLDDNVIFDTNSFTADDESVTLDVEGECHDFDWSAVSFNVSVEAGANYRMKINGSVMLSNMMIIGEGVDLRMFSSEAETFSMGDDPEVRKAEDAFGGRIEFLGSGSWTVLDHITNQESVAVNNSATLNLDGKPVYTANFSVVSSGTLITGDNTTITTHDWTNTSAATLEFGSNVEIILADNENGTFAQFSGDDNVFANVTIDNGKITRLDGANTFETLTLAPGSIIEFEANKTQTIDELAANGTRTESIIFYTDTPGDQAIISKADGTVDISFVKLTDMQATGGATFNAGNSIDNGNNTGWNITAPTPLDYYWVGGSGNWSDVNRWATTSGGSTFHSNPPTTFDNVFFDNNSFSANNQVVTADGDIYCHDMDWSQMTAYDIDLEAENYSNDYLYLSGSYFGSAGFTNDMFRIYFTSSGNETVSANGASRMGVYLYLDGPGTWDFTDNPNPTGFTVQSGSGVFTGSVFSAQYFSVDNNAFEKSVDLTDVTANFRYLTISENDPLEFTWVDDNSILNVRDQIINSSEVTLSHIKLVTGASSPIGLNNSTTYGTLEMEAGVDVNLGNGTTHTTDILILNGTKFNSIDLSSATEGTQATLSVSSGTVEGNYLILQDIVATGGATFNANNSTDQGNNSGWNITPPIPADYYWIGGTGEWTDINNWSQISGGAPNQATLPGSIDNVFFDQNSFTADEQVVNLPSGDISFHDFNVDTEFAADFSKSGNNTVVVLGSINMNGPADILFNPQMESNTPESISMTNGATTRTMRFNGTGTWTFNSSAKVNGDLGLIGGNLDFNEQSIDFTSLYLSGDFGTDFPKTLDASNAELIVGYQISISQFSSDFTADFSGSTIHIYGSRLHGYNDQNSPDNMNDVVFHDLIVHDQIEIRGNYEFNDITIEEGGISLKKRNSNDVPQLKFNSLSGTGTIDEPLVFEGLDPGVQWDYISKNAVNVDLEYVTIRDSKASGATFTAINSTDNGNNSGWNIQAPPNVPDAPVLSVISQDVEEATIGWDAVSNANEYKLELATDNTFSNIAREETVSETEVSFSTLTSARRYYVRAYSKNEGGFSSESATVVILTLPDAPTANEAFSVTTDAFTANWDELDGEVDSYSLDVSDDENFGTFLEDYENLTVDGNSQRIEGLPEDGLYYYRVRGVNTSGSSANSATITVSTSLRATQEITFPAFAGQTFGDDPIALSATSTSELEVYYESANESIAEIVGNEVVILGAGEVNITAFQDGNENFKAATPVTRLLIIGKADQIITFDELPAKTDADENFELTATSSSGLTVTYSSSNEDVATINGNTVTLTGSGSSVITASQEGNENYNEAPQVMQTLNVEASLQEQTITFEELPVKTFGDSAFQLTGTSTSGLAVAFRSLDNTVATVSGSELTIVGAGSTVIIASQAGDNEYQAANEVQRTLTVNKADQTITFGELPDKTDTDEDFELSATATSGLTVTFASSDLNVATIDGNTVSIVGAGTATITASQEGNDNYNAASEVQQTLIVSTKTSQTITFEELLVKTYGDPSFELTGTASSGLTVTYSSSDENVAAVNGSEVNIVGAGSVVITASQSGNDEFQAAADVEQTLTVNKADQVITFEELEDINVGEVITILASASSGLSVSFIVEGPANLNELELEGTDVGTVTVTAVQEGNANYNSADNVSRSFHVNEEVALGVKDEVVAVYPNPFTTSLNINSTSPANLKIYNLNGAEAYSKTAVSGSIDLSGLKSGTYLVELTANNTKQRIKIRKIN